MATLSPTASRRAEGQNHPLAGALTRILASALVTAMFALVKLAEQKGVHVAETVFYRQAFALPVVVTALAMGPGLGSVRTTRFGAHVTRTAVGLTGMVLNFLGMILLPMAEASALLQTVPLFATLLAVAFLGERVGPRRWTALIVGLVGVIIMIQPSGSAMTPMGVAASLAAALGTASVSVLLRDLGRTEGALTTVFWFSLLSLAPAGLAMLWFAQPHPPAIMALLVAMGALGGLAQIALTRALQLAPVSVVLPMDYSGLLFGVLFGWMLFGTKPGAATLAGSVLIIAAGLYIILRDTQSAAHSPMKDETCDV